MSSVWQLFQGERIKIYYVFVATEKLASLGRAANCTHYFYWVNRGTVDLMHVKMHFTLDCSDDSKKCISTWTLATCLAQDTQLATSQWIGISLSRGQDWWEKPGDLALYFLKLNVQSNPFLNLQVLTFTGSQVMSAMLALGKDLD